MGYHQISLKDIIQNVNFDKDTSRELKSLLEMSKDQYEGIMTRWGELTQILKFKINLSDDFKMGFTFGKMESKFVSWFYSIYARSMDDDEYIKFWDLVKNYSKKLNISAS
jgi:hypothetical protein